MASRSAIAVALGLLAVICGTLAQPVQEDFDLEAFDAAEPANGALAAIAEAVAHNNDDDELMFKAFPETCGTHTTDNPARYDVSQCKGVHVGGTCEVKCASGFVGAPVTVQCVRGGDALPMYAPAPRPKCAPACRSRPDVSGPPGLYNFTDCNTESAPGTNCTVTCRSFAKGAASTYTCKQLDADKAEWTAATEGSCDFAETWPKFVPGVPWINKAWCPQWRGKPDICQYGLLDGKYPKGSYVHVDSDVPDSHIKKLKEKGHLVVCYISGGTWEGWRGDAKAFPKSVIGMEMSDWEENWFDIRRSNPDHRALRNLIEKRVISQKHKGCDAIEYDNVDCWANRCVKGEKPYNKYMHDEQLAYNKWLAFVTHKHGMAVGLKNNIAQIEASAHDFDFAVNEECHHFNECGDYKFFTQLNKAVIGHEYNYKNAWAICSDAIKNKWTWMIKDKRTWVLCPLEDGEPAPDVESPGVRPYKSQDKNMSH